MSTGGLVFLLGLAAVLYFLPLGWAGYLMLGRFGRGGEGALYAALLGIIGLVVCWVMRDEELRTRALHERRLVSGGTDPEEALSMAWDSEDEQRRRRHHRRSH